MLIAETDRLIISKFTLKDALFFLELTNSPKWIKYIGDRNLKTVKDAEEYIKNNTLKNYSDFGFGFYKIQLKEEGLKTIGTCGLIKRETLDDVDIGFALLPDHESKGFGYESSIEILKLARKLHLKRIAAITLPTNKNSIKLIEKLGLSFEKKVKPFEDDVELLLFTKKLD